jgi:hypothetical protein
MKPSCRNLVTVPKNAMRLSCSVKLGTASSCSTGFASGEDLFFVKTRLLIKHQSNTKCASKKLLAFKLLLLIIFELRSIICFI